MKYVLLFLFGILIFTAFTFTKTEAFLMKGFAGKVEQAPSSAAACASVVGGPVMIRPIVSSMPHGPYDVAPSSSTKSIRVGSWILGLYSPLMMPSCITPEGTPYSAYPATRYGTSKL